MAVKISKTSKAIEKKFGSANKTRKLKIKLYGKNNKNKSTTITIPVNPEKITYNADGYFQEYQIINKGTSKIPNGKDVSYVGWECFFPGASLKNEKYVIKYKSPSSIRKQIEYWRRNGKKIKVSITTTPINMYAYINSYAETYEGSNGNIYYSIELVQAVDIEVDRVKKKKNKTSGTKRTSKRSSGKSYVVKKGDCLWNISKKYYKKGSQWKKIYNANKSTIEKAAKKHGKKSSSNGHWIYPGTKLKIP